MVESNEHRTAVTPIKKSMKFQKEKNKRKSIDGDGSKFNEYDIIFNGRAVNLQYNSKTDEILIDDKLYSTQVDEEDGFFIATVGGNHVYKIEHHDGQIFIEGRLIEFDFKRTVAKLKRIGSTSLNEELIRAPLPGKVVSIAVKTGDKVKSGQRILTLEAMKMQNEITNTLEGYIHSISVNLGELVRTDDPLVLIGKDKN
ncbi:MAG: acetyl-CoA carboxylase biotin carboxyl carrier protein subunit [Candidatus Kariarchaeaceae archaeon]|jgi:acetyl/propionyl-CoA carboxylase alpha subunit